jgi:hypothetical protein
MARYLIQLRAHSGWTSVIKELTDTEAALVLALADDLTNASYTTDGAAMDVRPVALADEDELREAHEAPAQVVKVNVYVGCHDKELAKRLRCLVRRSL